MTCCFPHCFLYCRQAAVEGETNVHNIEASAHTQKNQADSLSE